MKWEEKVKTVCLQPDGTRLQTELKAIEIIREPNRNLTESVLKSLCIAVDQLVTIQEEQNKRIIDLVNQTKKVTFQPRKKSNARPVAQP